MAIRKRRVIAVAPTLLHEVRTAPSVFKILVLCFGDGRCSILAENESVEQIRCANLPTWGEIVMCARYEIEAAEKMVRDVMTN